MGSRYGRNQRRAHRERIAALELAERRARERAYSAETKARTAREDVLREFVQAGPYYGKAMERIGAELGRMMGPHFAPHVKKLMDANQTRRSEPITWDAKVSMDQMTVSYIEGRIEPIYYRLAVSELDWR
jgi:hypothetical protein